MSVLFVLIEMRNGFGMIRLKQVNKMKKSFTIYEKIKAGQGDKNCRCFGVIITFNYSHSNNNLNLKS